jgi:3-oxoacyl-[acyl-carrier protein] reductase
MYQGKTVLITGSSRGIGAGLVKHFLYNGADVIGIARDAVTDGRFKQYPADLFFTGDIDTAFGWIEADFSKIDIVINNAATLTSQYATKMGSERVETMFAVNVVAPFVVTTHALKLMKKVKHGRIINISSMAVALEPMGDSVYAASKVALEKMGNIIAKEVAFMDITVNTLAVSAIETDMLRQLNKEKVDKVVNSLPLPRYATMNDIENVVDFFCSEKSSYITAQTIYLGGVHA